MCSANCETWCGSAVEGQRQELQSREGQQQRSDILQPSSGRWLRFPAGEASTDQNKNVASQPWKEMYVYEIMGRDFWRKETCMQWTYRISVLVLSGNLVLPVWAADCRFISKPKHWGRCQPQKRKKKTSSRSYAWWHTYTSWTNEEPRIAKSKTISLCLIMTLYNIVH